MDIQTANLLVDTCIDHARDYQNLAQEEHDPQVRDFLIRAAARESSLAVEILNLPIGG